VGGVPSKPGRLLAFQGLRSMELSDWKLMVLVFYKALCIGPMYLERYVLSQLSTGYELDDKGSIPGRTSHRHQIPK
jgi:hypothetical protein